MTARGEAPVIGAAGIEQLLRARFPPPAWALLTAVRNQTGYARTVRTADAVAMSLWPSRGLELHGIEIKVSRSDFRREVDDPSKAEEIARFCDRWWIAAPPDVVEPELMPPTWGLLVVEGRGARMRLKVAREAPKLDAEPITRSFLAALFRKIQSGSADARIDQELATQRYQLEETLRKEAREKAAKEYATTIARLEESLRDERREKADFIRDTGIPLVSWSRPSVLAAMRAMGFAPQGRELPTDALRQRLLDYGERLSSVAVSVAEAAASAQKAAASVEDLAAARVELLAAAAEPAPEKEAAET